MDWVILVAVVSVIIGLGLTYMLFAEVFGQFRGETGTDKRGSKGVTEQERISLTRVSTAGRFVSKAPTAAGHDIPAGLPSAIKSASDRSSH